METPRWRWPATLMLVMMALTLANVQNVLAQVDRQQAANEIQPGKHAVAGPAGELSLPTIDRLAVASLAVQSNAVDFLVQSTAGLTLPVLEEMALGSNPSIQRWLAIVAAARGNVVQVGLPPNPSLGYQGQQLGSRGLAEQHGVMIDQEFVRRPKLNLNRAVACQDVAIAEQELAAQRLRVLTDVRITFYRVLRAQSQLEVTTELLEISRKALTAAEALFKAQEVGKTDVLQARLEVESATIQSENAANRYRASWTELCAVTGQPNLLSTPLAGDLFLPAREFAFEHALQELQSTSPEIAIAATALERARMHLRRQQVEVYPNLTVQGLVNWRDNGIGGLSDGGLAVAAPLPLWNRNQGAIQQARYQVAVAEQALLQLQLDLQNRLAPAFERYSNSRNQVERIRDRILPAASETLELTTKTYQAGEINFVALLTVQRTYNQHRLAYLDSLEALRIAEAEIEGLLLSGSLQNR